MFKSHVSIAHQGTEGTFARRLAPRPALPRLYHGGREPTGEGKARTHKGLRGAIQSEPQGSVRSPGDAMLPRQAKGALPSTFRTHNVIVHLTRTRPASVANITREHHGTSYVRKPLGALKLLGRDIEVRVQEPRTPLSLQSRLQVALT